MTASRQCIRCTVCYPGPSGEHETDPAERVYPKLGSCTVNPYSLNVFSHHTVLPDDMPASEASRRVLVVGGGPGGMQAAIDAHDRGHHVKVVDDAQRLGGTLKICDTDSIKTELLAFRDHLIREVGRRDIEVRLGEQVTAQFVRDFAPEALVIAIGAVPLAPPIPGIDTAITGLQTYFVDPSTIGKTVVILGGGLVGSETGLEWAAHGRDVTVVEQRPRLVPEFPGHSPDRAAGRDDPARCEEHGRHDSAGRAAGGRPRARPGRSGVDPSRGHRHRRAGLPGRHGNPLIRARRHLPRRARLRRHRRGLRTGCPGPGPCFEPTHRRAVAKHIG